MMDRLQKAILSLINEMGDQEACLLDEEVEELVASFNELAVAFNEVDDTDWQGTFTQGRPARLPMIKYDSVVEEYRL